MRKKPFHTGITLEKHLALPAAFYPHAEQVRRELAKVAFEAMEKFLADHVYEGSVYHAALSTTPVCQKCKHPKNAHDSRGYCRDEGDTCFCHKGGK